MRVSVLSYKMPELHGTKYGCFAKLPRHPLEEGRRYFDTTYHDSYSKRFEQMNFHHVSKKTLLYKTSFQEMIVNLSL